MEETTYRAGRVYPESRRLKELIDSQGWTLYDTVLPDGRQFTKWAEVEPMGSATNFVIGKNYVFAPIPKKGQSLRDAYSITKGFGPSLLIEDHSENRWACFYLMSGRYQMGLPILFSRLDFQPKFLGAFSPPTRDLPEFDAIGISYSHAIDTFEKYFKIIRPEEEGLVIPIPMPVHPEDN